MALGAPSAEALQMAIEPRRHHVSPETMGHPAVTPNACGLPI
jgi:hypothetical protein